MNHTKYMIQRLRGTLLVGNELIRYFWKSKHWWMAPIVVLLLVLSIIIVAGHSAPIVTVIYPIF